ncbi:hypothetical protein DL762_001022 [Monosporascus cannonballus]|uniref:Uncharacterized protein n=1 Tax=Monosporascus cannonballus TaxID=155416 RepID=A0ABY0HLT8_9PEZI|nr:hypothetical protein DL762_001022 [Monosporascus cannonballus]
MEHGEQNPAADLEKGYGKHDRVAAHYVRDVTYRVIPICAVILAFFSDGAILVCTLAFDKPVPRQGAIGISITLAVLFFLFGLGGMYVYRKEHYRPIPKVASGLERPPPETRRRDKTVSMLRTLRNRGKRLTSYISNRSRSDDTSSRIIDGLDGVHTRRSRRSDRAEFVQTRTSDELTTQHPPPPGREDYEQGEAVAAPLQRNIWVQARGTNRGDVPQNAPVRQPGAPRQPNALNMVPGGAHATPLQPPARADPLQAVHQYWGGNGAYDPPRAPQGPDRALDGGHVGGITSTIPAGYNARPSYPRAKPQAPHGMKPRLSHQRNLFNQRNLLLSDTRSVASTRGDVNELTGCDTGGARVNLALVPAPPYLTEEAEAAYLQSELTNWIGAWGCSVLIPAAAPDGIESAAAADALSPPKRAGNQGSLRSADKSPPAQSNKPGSRGAAKTTTPPPKSAAGTPKRRQKRAGDKSPAAPAHGHAHGRARSAAASFEAGFRKLEADHASQRAALQRLSEVLQSSRPEQRAAVPARQPATPDTEGKGTGIETQRWKQRQEPSVTPKPEPLGITGAAGRPARKSPVRIVRTTPRRRRRQQQSPRKAASSPAARLSMVKRRSPGEGPAPPPLAERACLPLSPRRSGHSRRGGVVSSSSGSARVSTWKR